MHLKPEVKLGKNSTRVILIRHGQSTYNAEGRCQGRCDQAVLTEKGYNTVRQTGVALRGLDLDAVYTSPLKRAQESAREILAAMSTAGDLPLPQAADHLKEIDLPAWQGLTHTYIRAHFAEDYRCWKQRPHEFQMNRPQADGLAQARGFAVASPFKQHYFPVLDLYRQVQPFWQEIVPRHSGKTVLVVSHAGTHRALISTAMNLTPDRYHVLQQSNGGISILNFSNGLSQSAQLVVLNLTTHLGEVLPKLKEGKQGLRLLLVQSGATEHQIQKLAQFLKPVLLDFCLSSHLTDSQKTMEQILQFQTYSSIPLQVMAEDVYQWQQAISTRRTMAFARGDLTRPTTGLAVASDALTRSILSQLLGVNSDQVWHLRLDPAALSVIHYPSIDSLPVLQAMNVAKTRSLIRE